MSMATLNDTRSALFNALAPLGERGELIVVGQVAMATEHGGQQTMPTGGMGTLNGTRLLRSQEEVAMEPWTVCPLQGVRQRVSKADVGKEKGARLFCRTTTQNTAQRTASCSTAEQGLNLAFSLVHPLPDK